MRISNDSIIYTLDYTYNDIYMVEVYNLIKHTFPQHKISP